MKLIFACVVVFHFGLSVRAAEIRGVVKDAASSDLLSGVNISLLGTHRGMSSDKDGHFRMERIEPGEHELLFSLLGYQARKEKIKVELDETIEIEVRLHASALLTDPVIVTANKRDQVVGESAVSVSVMDAAEISFRNSRAVDDALRYIPGVHFVESQVNIRGSSGYNRGVGSRVSLLVDGIPMITGATGELIFEALPIGEVERIEVVKGASSALYGSNALGGVINVITKPPSADPITRVRTYGGFYSAPSFAQWEWTKDTRFFDGVSISHAKKWDDFELTLYGSRFSDDGYRRNDAKKRYNVFVKLGYALTPQQHITAAFNYFYQNRGDFLFWKNLDNALVPPDNQLADRVVSKRLRSTLQYRNVLSDEFLLQGNVQWYRNKFSSIIEAQTDRSTSDEIRGELQGTWYVHSNHVLTFGSEVIFDDVQSDLFGNRTGEGGGIYLQDEWDLTSDFHLTFGVRFDKRSIDSVSAIGGQFNPKAGIVFEASDRVRMRASYGRGFRAPTIGEAFTSVTVSGVPVLPNPLIKPEKSNSFEIGINAVASDFMLIDGALFRSDYFDLIEAEFTQSGAIQFGNVTRARVQGGEIATSFAFLDRDLVMNLAYTHIYPRNITLGEALQYRPRNIIQTSAVAVVGMFTFGADFRLISRYEEIDRQISTIVPDGDVRTTAYVFDARVGADFSRFDVPLTMTLNINNLFQYNYVEITGNLAPPRSYMLVMEAAL